MSMNPAATNATREKAPYEKPSIERVPLRPEEVVLGSCKSAASGGPNGASCSVPSACSTSGS